MKRHHRFLFSDAAAGQGGAAAGGTDGGGAGAGAGSAAAGGSGAGGGDQGGGQQQQQQAAGQRGGGEQPWYVTRGYDADTVKWIEERKFGSDADAMKAGREGSLFARDRNVLPKPDPKNLLAWEGFEQLGWTPDKTKYAVEKPQLADGDIHDDKAFSAFTGLAHEARLSPAQAKIVYDGMHKFSNQGIRDLRSAGAAENAKLDRELRSTWGRDYDANVTLARRAAEHFGGKDFTVAQIDAMIGSPATLKMFQAIGTAMGEDRLLSPQGDGHGLGGMTPGQADAELQKLQNNPDWMKIFNDPRHPQNKDYVAQRMRLIEIKAGQRAA